MATNSTPHTIRVTLKRVSALKRSDIIVPGRGFFTRTGTKIDIDTSSWGKGSWFVTGDAWMNDVPEMTVPTSRVASHVCTDLLHAPLDAYVVLER